MERSEAELIAAVLSGDSASFEPLIEKYSPRVFATARRYARRESEIEDRSVKEIAEITGWSVPLVKVRAFRARGEMRKILARMTQEKYL